jgi:hypothetical protein
MAIGFVIATTEEAGSLFGGCEFLGRVYGAYLAGRLGDKALGAGVY